MQSGWLREQKHFQVSGADRNSLQTFLALFDLEAYFRPSFEELTENLNTVLDLTIAARYVFSIFRFVRVEVGRQLSPLRQTFPVTSQLIRQ